MKCILFKKATKDKVALYEYIRWCHVISFREACKLFFCQLICLYLSVSTKLFLEEWPLLTKKITLNFKLLSYNFETWNFGLLIIYYNVNIFSMYFIYNGENNFPCSQAF